jgi:type I restriction enzyme S subunit
MKTEWTIKTLGTLCEVFADGDWVESKDQSTKGIRLIQTGNVGEGMFKDRAEKARYISEETFKRLRCTEIFEGDCLISRLPDPVGRSAIIPNTGERMITAVDCTILRFDKKQCLPKFFNYYSQSTEYLDTIAKECTETTRNRISRSNLALTPIPTPPLPEQKCIVAILDEAFAGIATAKAHAEKNLQNARELFESHLQAVFSERGEGWVEKSLGELGTITSSKRIFRSEYVKSGVPFYRTKEIKELANGREITTELFISSERYKEIKAGFGVPKVGDILLTAIGTIGEIWVVNGNSDFYFKDGNVLWLKEFTSINPAFLKYVLKSFVESLNKMSHGAAYSALPIQ